MSYLDDVRKRGLNEHQLDEVKEGLQKLTIDQVELYANGKYDHLQMREIRLALEEGFTKDQLDVFLNPSISWEVMQHNRTKILNANVIDEKATVNLRGKKLKNTFLFILIVVLVACGAVGIYYGKRYYDISHQDLQIVLDQDEITLQYGEAFNPRQYIKSYTEADNVELELPASIDTKTIGDVTVEYKLKNELKFITKELKVHIVDGEAPVITLSNQEVTLTRGEEKFSCKAYLTSATDDVDGDLTDNVQCGNADEKKDSQSIEYTVEDKSGNVGKAELTLNFKDPKPAPTPETIIVYRNSGGGSQSSQSSGGGGGGSAPQTQTSHGSQDFMFASGYDMDSGYQACIVAGSSHISYNCSPLQDAEGYYIGYRLTY